MLARKRHAATSRQYTPTTHFHFQGCGTLASQVLPTFLRKTTETEAGQRRRGCDVSLTVFPWLQENLNERQCDLKNKVSGRDATESQTRRRNIMEIGVPRPVLWKSVGLSAEVFTQNPENNCQPFTSIWPASSPPSRRPAQVTYKSSHTRRFKAPRAPRVEPDRVEPPRQRTDKTQPKNKKI